MAGVMGLAQNFVIVLRVEAREIHTLLIHYIRRKRIL